MALLFGSNELFFYEGMSVALTTRLITYWLPLVVSAIFSIYLFKMAKVPFLK